jgi:hypothetical protein
MQTPRTDTQPTDVVEPAPPSPAGAAPGDKTPRASRVPSIIVGVIVAAIAGLSIWFLVRPQPLLVQGEVDATRLDIAARVSWVIWSRIGLGVPARANSPLKLAATMPGRPASIAVGISGAAFIRCCAAIARMRTVPARWNWSSGPPTLGVIIGICPAARSVTPGAEPL